MDISMIKQQIGEMEDQGYYNKAIEWLYEQWMKDVNNPILCEMFIAECVWLCAYPGEYERAFPHIQYTYNFFDHMAEALEYGLNEFQDDFMFLLRVGYMMYAEETWFHSLKLLLSHEKIKQIRERMLFRACELRPTSIVAECVRRYVLSDGEDDIIKYKTDEIIQELAAYQLGYTNDDLEFLRFLGRE